MYSIIDYWRYRLTLRLYLYHGETHPIYAVPLPQRASRGYRPADDSQVNLEGTRNLLEVCRKRCLVMFTLW